jgi:hypothetical protein
VEWVGVGFLKRSSCTLSSILRCAVKLPFLKMRKSDQALRRASLDYLETISVSTSSDDELYDDPCGCEDCNKTAPPPTAEMVDIQINNNNNEVMLDNNGRPIRKDVDEKGNNNENQNVNNNFTMFEKLARKNSSELIKLGSLLKLKEDSKTRQQVPEDQAAVEETQNDFYSLAADEPTAVQSRREIIMSRLQLIFSEWPRSLLLCVQASTEVPIPEIAVWSIATGVTLGVHLFWAVSSALVLMGNYRFYIWSLSGSIMNAFLMPFLFVFWTFGCVQRIGNVTGWTRSRETLEREATRMIDGEAMLDTVELELLQAIEDEKRRLSTSKQMQIMRIWTCLIMGTFEWCAFMVLYLLKDDSSFAAGETLSKKTIFVIFETVSYLVFSCLILSSACSGKLVNAGNLSICFRATKANFEALSSH